MNKEKNEMSNSNRIGNYLKSERLGKNLSLREVEELTGRQVSNAYLSQLENGKISRPSPHILYSLATAMNLPYERLMESAGYIVQPKKSDGVVKHGRAATNAIENLTSDEEDALREYLSFYRTRKKK